MDISMLVNPLKRVKDFVDSEIKHKYQKENESSSNDCQIISENIPSNQINAASPILPPSLHPKEKMKILQEWVNSIPSDSPWDICESSSRSNSLTIMSDDYTKQHEESANVSDPEIIPNRQCKKLFTSTETQQIVHLFYHHFKQGTLPTIVEVRRLIQNSAIGLVRTPESVRAKIKRLHTTGDWASFLGKNFYTL